MLSNQGKSSVLINVNEHLTYSSCLAGFKSPASIGKSIKKMQDVLSKEIWASDPKMGFLNSDPALIGSGFKVSALVHFPGVCFCRQQDQLVGWYNSSR